MAGFLEASKAGKLSTRDRKLRQAVQLSPAEMLADELDSITPFSLVSLQHAISSAKSPDIKNILLEEQERVYELIRKHAPGPAAASKTDEVDMESMSDIINKVFSFGP